MTPEGTLSKKVTDFPVPSRDVTYQTLRGPAGNKKNFPVRESLVSDTLAGDGKTDNLFLQCIPLGQTRVHAMHSELLNAGKSQIVSEI